MPVVTKPNLIEQSDFLAGWAPDGESSSIPENALRDTLNLLPDRNTGSLQVRAGFKRLREEIPVTAGSENHYIKQVFWFRCYDSIGNFLILILTDESSQADNVQVWLLDLQDSSVTRIDTPGRTWLRPNSPHWGIAIDNVWYGGSRGNEMYSYDADADTWDATAATGDWKTWKAQVDDDIDQPTEYGQDFAWTGREKVYYLGDVYSPNKSIRFDDVWESGANYQKGDKVSRYTVWDSSTQYWKSFKCIKSHTSSAGNAPGTGGSFTTYWKKIRLDAPLDDEGNTSGAWDFVLIAPNTNVAAWHLNRMFMRFDGQGDESRVAYSAPLKYERNEDIPNTVFNPRDFAPGTDQKGAGGGWLTVNDGAEHSIIVALASYGPNLIVFKRRSTWVVTGTDDSNFSPRRLDSRIGCVAASAMVELEGLLYFMSEEGLMVTDGTQVQEAPGNEKVRIWLAARLDEEMNLVSEIARESPNMWTWDGFVWMSLPSVDSDEPVLTLVYDPKTQSFWKTDLPVLDAAVYAQAGVGKMVFVAPGSVASSALLLKYDHEEADDSDDERAFDYSSMPVPWRLRTAWWSFGTLREQRRIRRVWAIVRGAMEYTLRAFRDYDDDEVAVEASSTVSGLPAQHLEGRVFADSHAVSFELEGPERPASIVGIAVDTQPRRVRYHTG